MYFALLLLNHDVYCHHVRVKLRTWTEPQRYTSSLQCEKEHVSYKQLRHRNETWACKWLHVSTSNISSYHIASVKLIGKETIFPTPNYSCKRTNKQTNKQRNKRESNIVRGKSCCFPALHFRPKSHRWKQLSYIDGNIDRKGFVVFTEYLANPFDLFWDLFGDNWGGSRRKSATYNDTKTLCRLPLPSEQ